MLLVTACVDVWVETKRNASAARRNIKIGRARVSGLQRIAGAGKRIAALAGFYVEQMHVRHAAIGEPAIPVAETAVVDHMRPDLVVLLFSQTSGLCLLAGELRPYPGYKSDFRRIGKPLDGGDTGSNVCHAPRLAAVWCNYIQLRLFVRALTLASFCHKGNQRTIR